MLRSVHINTNPTKAIVRGVLEQLAVIQLVKKFPFLWMTMVLQRITKGSHWSLLYAMSLQLTYLHHIYLRSVLILYSHIHQCLLT